MEYSKLQSQLDGVPFIGPDRARALYDHIVRQQPEACLELGFAYGASTCFIAGALEENGAGHLTTVDIERARKWFADPSIEELLQRTGLEEYVTVHREKLSYTWFLKKEIEANTKDDVCEPIYDFCFIDGAHNWGVDGLAFFLADKLLKENGCLLFDDLQWSYDMANEQSIDRVEECGAFVRQMDEDERTDPHVGSIYKLLVQQHPSYGDFIVQDGNWGWARKTRDPSRTLTRIEPTIGSNMKNFAKRAIKKLTSS